jgi:hypothetical protein
MDKFGKFYINSLPIFSLISIVLSTFRSTGQGSYNEIYLLTLALFDLIIVYKGRNYINKPIVFIVVIMSLFTLIIGMFNFEFSRRFITDFTNPVFFFAKIYIFKEYWSRNDLSSYIKYYTRIAFIGSFLMLPLVYYMFTSSESTRLSIFPPLELPFSHYLINRNFIFLILSFLVMILYGKRAILVGSFMTFILYIVFINRKNFLKYVLLSMVLIVLLTQVLSFYSDNFAVKRLMYTFELFNSDEFDKVDKISAGRTDEIETIVKLMEPIDYVIGKGAGFKYYMINKGEIEEAANAHFSPLGFLSKYGVFFTILIYVFLIRIMFFKNAKHLNNKNLLTALCVSIFIFIESFFAYTTFVVPIYPVFLGAVLSYKNKNRTPILQQNEI